MLVSTAAMVIRWFMHFFSRRKCIFVMFLSEKFTRLTLSFWETMWRINKLFVRGLNTHFMASAKCKSVFHLWFSGIDLWFCSFWICFECIIGETFTCCRRFTKSRWLWEGNRISLSMAFYFITFRILNLLSV